MWAMAQTGLRQLRRDHRTVAMMVMVPLVVFGYAAGFDVSEIKTVVAMPGLAGQPTATPASVATEPPLDRRRQAPHPRPSRGHRGHGDGGGRM